MQQQPATSGLFLDVDGVLLPFSRDGQPSGSPPSRELVARLQGLVTQTVWSTAWLDDANKYVSPRFGLPDVLPVLGFRSTPPRDWPGADEWRHYKLPDIATYVRETGLDRAVIIDDDSPIASWIEEYVSVPTLQIRPRPNVGLTKAHVDDVERWLKG